MINLFRRWAKDSRRATRFCKTYLQEEARAQSPRGQRIQGCVNDIRHARSEQDIRSAWDHLAEALTCQ